MRKPIEDTLGDSSAEDRNFVTSLARGLDVLRCFRPAEAALTNMDLSSRTGLPKPTVTRLCYTLCKLGYLVQSERSGTYRLGAGVLSLGYGVLASMDMGERAADEMRALCEGPNLHVTAALGERHQFKVVYMAVRRSQQAVSLTLNVGARLPLFHSAIGRAILCSMPGDERERITRQADQENPDDAAAMRRSLAQGLSDYRQYGFCTSFGSWRSEVNGIAVPVVSLNGDRVYGLNIGGPSFLISPDELLESYGDRLLAAAQRLCNLPTGVLEAGSGPGPGPGLA